MPAKALSKYYGCGVLLLFLAMLLCRRAAAQDINPRITFLGGASLLSGSTPCSLAERRHEADTGSMPIGGVLPCATE